MSYAGDDRDFLAGGGEMGKLVRAFDWQNSEIGAPDPELLFLPDGLIFRLRTPAAKLREAAPAFGG